MITRRGYQLNKNNITNKQLLKIEQDMTLTPKINENYNFNIESFSILHQTQKNVFLPKYYGIKHFNKKQINFKTIINSTKCDMIFKSSLRDNQQKIIDDIYPKILNNGGGIITLPCGFGKTVIALYIASLLKLKTLILVHKTFLQDQWVNKIHEFLPRSTIGIIQQNIVENNNDFIVGMIQSISQKNYDKDIFDDIGLIIVDECHHIASRVFSKSLYKIGANYTIGLSATPNRKDGLTKVIKWYLGEQLCNITEHINKETIAYQFLYKINDEKNILFKEMFQYAKGKYVPNIVKMTTNLTKIQIRNEFIINIIIKLIQNPLRKILILSSRINHLKFLKENTDNLLEKLNIKTQTNFYIGESSKNERIEAEQNASIIFASYSMAHEGLDIPKLNTIILTTPQKDIVQSIGRIMRKHNNKDTINPLIIDIVDELSVFSKYGFLKYKLYKKNNYKITNFNIINSINENDINQIFTNEYMNLISNTQNENNIFDNKYIIQNKIIEEFCLND